MPFCYKGYLTVNWLQVVMLLRPHASGCNLHTVYSFQQCHHRGNDALHNFPWNQWAASVTLTFFFFYRSLSCQNIVMPKPYHRSKFIPRHHSNINEKWRRIMNGRRYEKWMNIYTTVSADLCNTNLRFYLNYNRRCLVHILLIITNHMLI